MLKHFQPIRREIVRYLHFILPLRFYFPASMSRDCQVLVCETNKHNHSGHYWLKMQYFKICVVNFFQEKCLFYFHSPCLVNVYGL